MDLAFDDRLRAAVEPLRFVIFDFDGVFTDNLVYVLEDGRELVRCSRADGLGLRRLESLGLECMILSTEKNPVVVQRSKKLQIECISGCDDKLSSLTEQLQRRRLSLKQTAFVGNDINDLSCLEAVGCPIVVGDAHPEVLEKGCYRTRAHGGRGAVREVCDLIYYLRRQSRPAG